MRGMSSDATLLKGSFVLNRYIARVLPPGLTGADLFALAILA
jgi:hypothetical protein